MIFLYGLDFGCPGGGYGCVIYVVETVCVLEVVLGEDYMLVFCPRRPMYMPQLLTGTSMPARPPLRLLPTLASNHSILTRSPGCKPLICLSTCISPGSFNKANLPTQVISNLNNRPLTPRQPQTNLATLCLLKLSILLHKHTNNQQGLFTSKL